MATPLPLADLVLRGGTLLTMDAAQPRASALAARDGHIVAVGDEGMVAPLIGPATRIVELNGRTALPGLVDAHAHMDREGLRSVLPSLNGITTMAALQARIAALAATTPKGEWIVTMPLGEAPAYGGLGDGTVWPTRHDLDAVAPDHPVYIRSIWGYWGRDLPIVSIANSMALRLAGIGPETVPPVASVEIDRDPRTGEPTGILRDHNKIPVVEHTLMRAAPRFTAELRAAALRRSQALYNSFGTTTILEAHGVAPDTAAGYQRLRETNALSVRAMLLFSPAWGDGPNADRHRLLRDWGRWLAGRGLGDAWLRMAGFYAEVDASAERRARLIDAPNNGWAGFNLDCGLPRDDLLTLLVEAARQGIRVAGVFPYMLDLFAEVDKQAPIAGQRWIFGHLDTMNDAQIATARHLELAVTAHPNAYLHRRGAATLARVGADRAHEIVPLRRLLDAGVQVSLSTDNVPINLFQPISHVVTRAALGLDRPVAPDQALSRAEALHCATMGGAWAAGLENEIGSLTIGKRADMAVLDGDPMTCPDSAIRNLAADITIVNGRIVHNKTPKTGGPT
jgi:predicted amidohydrolase YtcJ